MPFSVPSNIANEITAVNQEFMAAFKSQDATRLAKTYCKEGRALPAGAPVQRGQNAIRDLFQGVMDMGVVEAILTPDELFACDNSGHPHMIGEMAKWEFKDKQGNTMDKGKFLVLFVQEDGKWKYLYDMFSSNGPVVASA